MAKLERAATQAAGEAGEAGRLRARVAGLEVEVAAAARGSAETQSAAAMATHRAQAEAVIRAEAAEAEAAKIAAELAAVKAAAQGAAEVAAVGAADELAAARRAFGDGRKRDEAQLAALAEGLAESESALAETDDLAQVCSTTWWVAPAESSPFRSQRPEHRVRSCCGPGQRRRRRLWHRWRQMRRRR